MAVEANKEPPRLKTKAVVEVVEAQVVRALLARRVLEARAVSRERLVVQVLFWLVGRVAMALRAVHHHQASPNTEARAVADMI